MPAMCPLCVIRISDALLKVNHTTTTERGKKRKLFQQTPSASVHYLTGTVSVEQVVQTRREDELLQSAPYGCRLRVSQAELKVYQLFCGHAQLVTQHLHQHRGVLGSLATKEGSGFSTLTYSTCSHHSLVVSE